MGGRKVSYYYDPDIGDFYYGQGHPMKPHRVRLAHCLVTRYDLWHHLDIVRPCPARKSDLVAFHTPDYVDFLRAVTPANQDELSAALKQFAVGSDCPIFDRMYQYCQIYAGASLGAAMRLNHGLADTAINWAGGMHHAKKAEASGFCYVNDIVLAVLELLKYHARVLYVDIDVHHGDGVEEAFLTSDRVMTVSFHKHGDNFFPGTGDTADCGVGAGRGYAVNVPLRDGMDDPAYEGLFRPVMGAVMERFRPEAIVLQSGADSLAGDKLGPFNLSIPCHGRCHAFLAAYGLPLLALGGGGYKVKNVARCWAYETGVLLGVESAMADRLPPNDYYEVFAPDYRLTPHLPQPDKPNLNRKDYLDKVRTTILERLRGLHPPGVSFHERPPDVFTWEALRRGEGGSGCGGGAGEEGEGEGEGGRDGFVEGEYGELRRRSPFEAQGGGGGAGEGGGGGGRRRGMSGEGEGGRAEREEDEDAMLE
ncbi:hypothetical protein CHLRE_06g277350v5 [Chlamydomonas reinhardtii]|uniref:Histone deacetylase n=1 Tax=Chlamydomonas reinhardtii TaxID=3055 RepID=A0A2K3DNR6_CHLRE|nr:uncharacterized protein CHLRE_06g277350v5 [Chlamydomonas reinhardtii]PNW82179.1 hypothetical protein CHLRE_06g277350v5 [Chlamydomonas reinhardtii]